MTDATWKFGFAGWQPPDVRARLAEIHGTQPTEREVAQVMDFIEQPDRYRVRQDQNELVRSMLEIGSGSLAPVIASKSWILARCSTPRLITSDHPVAYYQWPSNQSDLRGVGLANADEVYFPLDPNHVLILAQPSLFAEGDTLLGEENVVFANSLIASSSYQWVYQHPDGELLDEVVQMAPRPLMYINQKPIY